MVQERIEDVRCELRIHCFRDLAGGPGAVKTELVRMGLHPPRHENLDPSFSLTSHHSLTERDAAESAFDGSKDALKFAEKEAHRLAGLWLEWLKAEGFGVPAACRLDFLVALQKRSRGSMQAQPELWTVELCECGGSLCGVPHGARTAAALNECIMGDMSEKLEDNRFPLALPSTEVVEVQVRDVAAAANAARPGRPWQNRGRGDARNDRSPKPQVDRTLGYCVLGGAFLLFLLRVRGRRIAASAIRLLASAGLLQPMLSMLSRLGLAQPLMRLMAK